MGVGREWEQGSHSRTPLTRMCLLRLRTRFSMAPSVKILACTLYFMSNRLPTNPASLRLIIIIDLHIQFRRHRHLKICSNNDLTAVNILDLLCAVVLITFMCLTEAYTVCT